MRALLKTVHLAGLILLVGLVSASADGPIQATPDGGGATTIQYYNTSEVGTNVDAILQNSSSPGDYYLFYTTPTTPADIYPYIEYTLDMTVQAAGVLDKAKNQWDMDDSTDPYEDEATWTFGIDAGGNPTNFQEQYQ